MGFRATVKDKIRLPMVRGISLDSHAHIIYEDLDIRK